MGRGVHDPEDRFGDVLRLDRLGACIGGVVLGLIAAKTHQRELAFAQARLKVGHTDTGADQVVAQVQRELANERLGAAINVTARIRVVARHRTQVDDARATAVSDQARKQRAGGVDQAFDVGVDHGVPVVQVALGRRVDAQGETCVVDQATDLRELGRQIFNSLLNGLTIAHVQCQGVHLGLFGQLGAQRLQTLFTATGQHQRPARLCKTACTGLAKPGSGTGNEHGRSHVVLLTEGFGLGISSGLTQRMRVARRKVLENARAGGCGSSLRATTVVQPARCTKNVQPTQSLVSCGLHAVLPTLSTARHTKSGGNSKSPKPRHTGLVGTLKWIFP